MEIREFAQRVLFSTSLEEKLAPAGELYGCRSRAPRSWLREIPGGPPDLRLRANGVRADFPGVAQLINEEQRGILLHFFANHELLATELMALVLREISRGARRVSPRIVHTLQEEQQHTKWYLRRMQECGRSASAILR